MMGHVSDQPETTTAAEEEDTAPRLAIRRFYVEPGFTRQMLDEAAKADEEW